MRIKLAHIALILSIIALAVSLFTAVQVNRNSDDALIDALMAQNEQLQAQIDALAGQSSAVPNQSGIPELGSATLTAVSWADSKGADITLTLKDTASVTSALLRVLMDGEPVTEVPCQWSGSCLTATAQIPAGNGYTYTAVIDGAAFTLASPGDSAYPELVNLSESLGAYCNLVVGSWHVQDNTLTLDTCFAHVQTPQLSTGDPLTCEEALLVIKNGDIILDDIPIQLELGEGKNSYESEVSGITFALPALAEGEQIDLWLEATLSNGQILTTCAASWYAMPSGFSMAAG